MATQSNTRRIVVQIDVQGDKKALNSLVQLEKAKLAFERAQNRSSSGTQNAANTQRQLNQAMTQSSQQVQDFMVQISSGQRITTAFNQQIGQLGFVMQGFENSTSKAGKAAAAFGRFMSGPWGLAVLFATSALSVLTATMGSNEDAADGLADAQIKLSETYTKVADQREALDKALGRSIGQYKELRLQALLAAKTELEASLTSLKAAQARLKVARAQRDELLALKDTSSGIVSSVALMIGMGDISGEVKGLKNVTEQTSKATDTAIATLENWNKTIGKIGGKESKTGKAKETIDELTKAIQGFVEGAREVVNADKMLQGILTGLDALLESGAISWRVYKDAVEAVAKSYGLLEGKASFIEIGAVKDGSTSLAPGLSQEEIDKAMAAVQNGIPTVKEMVATWYDVSKAANDAVISIVQDFGSAIGDAVSGTESLGKAFEGFGRVAVRVLAELAAKWAILQLLGALLPGGKSNSLFGSVAGSLFPSAKGNVFDQGKVTPFATGGIVSKPTMFPLRSGLGLMGEAGPEAIMPLRRGGDGRLGVSAAPVNVTVINNTPANVRVQDQGNGNVAVIVDQARKAIAADIARGDGDVARSLQSTYRLSRGR